MISKGPLIDYAPLIKLGEGDVNTQYDMGWVERIGLLKMDFLGLRNLTVMKNAVDEIRRTTDPAFDLDDDPRRRRAHLRDARRAAKRLGVFQLESDGMRRVCVGAASPSASTTSSRWSRSIGRGRWSGSRSTSPTSTAASKPSYLHPKLEPILRDTYGDRLLPRTSHADRARHRRLHDGRSRRAAQGHGQEAEGQDPGLPREVRRRRGRERHRGRSSPRRSSPSSSRSPATASTSRTRRRTAGSPIKPRISRRTIRCNIFAALMTSVKRQDRQARRVHRRGQEARHRGVAARRQRVADRLRRRRRARSASAWRRSRASAKARCDRSSRARERDGKFADLFDLAKRVDAKHVNRRSTRR